MGVGSFVDGSVTVNGKIAGNGALVATKNITVTGSMNTSADLAALVAGGDISITGQGTTTSSFQGLILAEGSFKAKDTTLIGSALTLDENGSVQLERVRTVAARDLTKIDLSYAAELKKAMASNQSSSSGGFGQSTEFAIMYQSKPTSLAPSEYDALTAIANSSVSSGDSTIPGIIKDGKFITQNDPAYAAISTTVKNDFLNAAAHWNAFQQQTNTSSVVYVNVFQLDFNKFLKTKGGLRPLLQRVSSI